MKLSKIKGERVFDVIADIINPIANIAEDKEAAALFQRQKLPDGVQRTLYWQGLRNLLRCFCVDTRKI